jgi:hypothetical protein
MLVNFKQGLKKQVLLTQNEKKYRVSGFFYEENQFIEYFKYSNKETLNLLTLKNLRFYCNNLQVQPVLKTSVQP